MLSYKELTAAVQLMGQVLVGVWLVYDLATGGLAGATVAGVATKLLWVIGAVIVFTIIGVIVAVIAVSIAQREELKDEATDERDRDVEARSQRNSAYVTSVAAALALFPLALGADPVLAVYALFLAPMLGGTVNAASQLYYYRIG